MQTDITTENFKKNLSKAILFLVMVIVMIVLATISTIAANILNGYSFIFSIFNGTVIATNYSASVVFSILLIIFAAVGKVNATKNRIMAFVFGIIALIIVVSLLADRGYHLIAFITGLVVDIGILPSDPVIGIFVGLLSGLIAVTAIIIAFGIVSIITNVAIIKENVPKGASSTATVKTEPRAAPATTVTPKTIKNAAPSETPEFCDGCGAPLNADSKFCESCGKAVE
ncbi:MAG TPA: zinc ribbon domain-containing protein [Candidatus Lokiarchaeia archaeon]|nr:zinc ribbon domain-containing protein [Candidatus Lokiarchaeia archaeon]